MAMKMTQAVPGSPKVDSQRAPLACLLNQPFSKVTLEASLATVFNDFL